MKEVLRLCMGSWAIQSRHGFAKKDSEAAEGPAKYSGLALDFEDSNSSRIITRVNVRSMSDP
jgi:hypothetical protein